MDMPPDRHTDGDPVDSGNSVALSSPFDDDVDRIAPVAEDGTGDGQTKNPNVETHDCSSTEQQQLMSEPKKHAKAARNSGVPALRYRRTSIWLLACYLPFLILPWILTCIMAHRPPSFPSYYNQRGDYCGWTLVALLFWSAFVRILNSIGSILVITITSALLAHGAVVYTQRRKSEQKLDLRQTFALSDHGWNDTTILWSAYRGRGPSSKYLTLAACLLLLNAIQAPVREALIGYELIFVMTCADLPLIDSPVVGYDPEPHALAITPQIMVIPDLIKSLATVNNMDFQPYLWRDPGSDWSEIGISGSGSTMGSTLYVPHDYDQKLRYFVSAFLNNTNTGVLREHVMRLNSSAECKTIDEIAFPTTCDGPDPFMASYSSQSKADNVPGFGNFTIDVCVPGNLSASPWTLSRDRQHITEHLYIKVHVDYAATLAWDLLGETANFTVHCTGNTTRGYFELPNSRNNLTAGPLLKKWPDIQTLENDFNDYLHPGLIMSTAVPTTIDNVSVTDPTEAGNWDLPIDPFNRFMRATPGPLMTSALAMFGKDSFFYVASNSTGSSYPSVLQQICQAGNIPFARLDRLYGDYLYTDLFRACSYINDPYSGAADDSLLDPMLYQWFSTFYPQKIGSYGAHTYSKEALEVAMFFANQHWLLETATATKTLYSARNIYTSPGFPMVRPLVPLYAKITVSILIALQLFGLGVLVRYIYSVPTWTEKLDSCAIAQLTNDVDAGIFSTIKKPDDKALQELKHCNGLVGVAEEYQGNNTGASSDGQKVATHMNAVDAASSQSDEEDQHVELVSTAINDDVRLVRGGTGFITRRHASFEEWKPEFRFKRRKATKESLLEKGD